MSKRICIFLSLSLLTLRPAFAAHPFFCTDSAGNKVAVVSAEGKIEWEYPCSHP